MENLRDSLVKRLRDLKQPEGVIQQWNYSFENGRRKTVIEYDEILDTYERIRYKMGLSSKELERWEREGPFSWITIIQRNGTFIVYGITDESHRGRFFVTPYTIHKKTLEKARESRDFLMNCI